MLWGILKWTAFYHAQNDPIVVIPNENEFVRLWRIGAHGPPEAVEDPPWVECSTVRPYNGFLGKPIAFGYIPAQAGSGNPRLAVLPLRERREGVIPAQAGIQSLYTKLI